MIEREPLGIAVPPFHEDSGTWLVEVLTIRQYAGQTRGVRYAAQATHAPTGSTCGYPATTECGQLHVARAHALRLFHILARTPVSSLPPHLP